MSNVLPSADGGGTLAAAEEFKEMVRRLHNAGIEVILDVVYNHTAEGGPLVIYSLSSFLSAILPPCFWCFKVNAGRCVEPDSGG